MRIKVARKSFAISMFILIISFYLAWLHKEEFYLLNESIESDKIFLEDGRTIVQSVLQINIFVPCLIFGVGLYFLVKSIWSLLRPTNQNK